MNLLKENIEDFSEVLPYRQKEIKLVTNMPTNSGGGRYAREISRQLDLPLVDSQDEIKFPMMKRTLNSYFHYPNIKFEADLIHATNQFLAKVADKNPAIVTVLDMYAFKNLKALPFPTNLIIKRIEKSLSNAEMIIAISKFTKRELEERGISVPCEVVYLGASDHYRQIERKYARAVLGFHIKSDLKSDDKILLSIGNENDERKNIGKIMEVFRHLKGWKIIRLGEQEKEYPNLINIMNLPENFMPFLYSSVDVFLNLEKEAGFGLTILEAMSCGTPSVCSKTGSFPELNPSVLVDAANSPEKIAEDVERMYGRTAVLKDKFTWEECAEKHKKIYEEI